MKVTVYMFTWVILTFGCGQVNKGNSTNPDSLLPKKEGLIAKPDTTKINSANTHSGSTKNWPDSLIQNYIEHSDNKLIRLTFEGKISEKWLFDQIIKTDTAKYFVFQIGHEVMDSGKTNKRFITDSWIYIDSLKNTIYEYDLPKDLLIKWSK